MHKGNEVIVQFNKICNTWMQTHTYRRFLPGLGPFLVFSKNVENSNWYIGLYVFVYEILLVVYPYIARSVLSLRSTLPSLSINWEARAMLINYPLN